MVGADVHHRPRARGSLVVAVVVAGAAPSTLVSPSWRITVLLTRRPVRGAAAAMAACTSPARARAKPGSVAAFWLAATYSNWSCAVVAVPARSPARMRSSTPPAVTALRLPPDSHCA